ncbi:MAG: TrkA family potassium uptake protein [Candidatus Tectomicrobia bacterium]|uniref:TrkA family potassium uptake protein n=1 Tax=Tectimicrobiota bacterium TaxID=2528274 RepID=A0A932CL93_UNCTE|nr:TrkA family potassium uptake protein [Candidatus Tectomicrobia bacterium]
MGKIVGRELLARRVSFVVIENSPDVLGGIGSQNILWIQGDATQDSVLEEAGVKHARGLIAVLSSDADNLYLVLSARRMNERLMIVARAGTDGSEQKLLRAGADRVVSPYHIGGMRIAHAMLKPAVVDFLELATQSENLELQMEELTVGKESSLANMMLGDCGIRRDHNAIVVAIKRSNGHMEFNPTADTILRPGDTLIVLAQGEQLKRLEALVGNSNRQSVL